jgi:hypothetical protein
MSTAADVIVIPPDAQARLAMLSRQEDPPRFEDDADGATS